jgi:hypothetical protein
MINLAITSTMSSIKFSIHAFFSLVFIAILSPLHALELDPNLNTLCLNRMDAMITNGTVVPPCGSNIQPDVASFKGLVGSYGLALAAPNVTPTNTLGVNAVSFGLVYGMTGLYAPNANWKNATVGNQKPSSLMNANLVVRKGLPYSFELEGSMGYLINSELFAVGGGLRWSPHEAVKLVPVDVSTRFHVRKVVGSSQMDLTTMGFDLSVGHEFGILKLFSIAPYVAYSPLWVYGSSNVLDATPGTFESPTMIATNGQNSAFVFKQQTVTIQRFTIGARFLIGLLQLTPEAVISGEQQTYYINLGVRL